jgi:hypothetical protein
MVELNYDPKLARSGGLFESVFMEGRGQGRSRRTCLWWRWQHSSCCCDTAAAAMLGNWSDAGWGRREEAALDLSVLQSRGVANADTGSKPAGKRSAHKSQRSHIWLPLPWDTFCLRHYWPKMALHWRRGGQEEA